MKTNIDDATIQAAIDEAFDEVAKKHPETCGSLVIHRHKFPDSWQCEAPARLALARALLARLPKPTPPVVDGKTPGQVAFDAFKNGSDSWEVSASAVLAAFGGAILEAAIARMEAVPWQELKALCVASDEHNDFETIRARLIAAARGEESQPAAVDLREALAIANRSADEQMRYKREAEARAEKAEAERAERPVGFNSALEIWDAAMPEQFIEPPTPEPAQPWQPAVGDRVQLKGGSFTMTVEQADSDGIACEWHDSNGVPQARTYTTETLQPA